MKPLRPVFPLLILALFTPVGAQGPAPGAGKAPSVEVVPAAQIEIQTFVVKDKASESIATDRARLLQGRRGGVVKTVTLTPSKKSKAAGSAEVEVKLLVAVVSSTRLAVELGIEASGKLKGAPAATVPPGKGGKGAKPTAPPETRARLRVTLEPGATKLIDLYEHEPFGAKVMAMIKADFAEPEVSVKGLAQKAAAAPPQSGLEPVTFQLDIKRLEEGKEVFAETQPLHTWVGKAAVYEMGQEVPTDVIARDGGAGTVRYASERAKLVMKAVDRAGASLKVEVQVVGNLYRGSDLANAYPIDRTVTYNVSAGQPFVVYAIYGQEELRGIDPKDRATAAGYVFTVTPQF